MKKMILAFMLLAAPLAQAQQDPTQADAPRCITLSEVDRTMPPVPLMLSMVSCIREGRDEDAVDLFNMSGVLAKFDTLRVSDRSAHSVYPALKMQVAQMLTEDERVRFDANLKTMSSAPGYQEKLCAFTAQLYPPTYEPRYMTSHGMGAFLGTPQSVSGFQPNAAWAQVRADYLLCKGPVQAQ